jgi:3-deoxy-manno-octulosonate cytidylyltransferase (CMP-KDO synthetase)
MDKPKVIVIIPARWDSKRLPGKAIADIDGTPMVVRVARQAAKVDGVDILRVATDTDVIADALGDEAEVIFTSPKSCRTGSDRVAQAAGMLFPSPHDLIVNVQGDMPFVPPSLIEDLMTWSLEGPGKHFGINTPAIRRYDPVDGNPVKVITGADASGFKNRAIFFSRAAMMGTGDGWDLHHMGLYAFRWAILKEFASYPQCQVEIDNGLEQLRAINHGLPIGVMETEIDCGPEVNTPEDLALVSKGWPIRKGGEQRRA